jgi:hypothetical protein
MHLEKSQIENLVPLVQKISWSKLMNAKFARGTIRLYKNLQPLVAEISNKLTKKMHHESHFIPVSQFGRHCLPN